MAHNDISIVIPCYNTNAVFIKEAIESVNAYEGRFSYEIIIVDDGSTDESTLQFLRKLSKVNTKVIFQMNKGPAAARNKGVKNSESEYILFLDSDDRLKPEYIEEGIVALNANQKVGVVYANADAFGDGTRTNFIAKSFGITELLIQNYIPMCVVMRRKTWEDVNGMDEELMQYEDWEFWIRIYKSGWEFKFIEKPMFEYRIQQGSLIAQSRDENFKKAVEYIYKKHPDLIYQVFHQLYATRIIYKNDMRRPLRSFFKYTKKKYLN